MLVTGALLVAPPASAQISSIDIPFMAFYDTQGVYAATAGIGAASGPDGQRASAADVLRAIEPRRMASTAEAPAAPDATLRFRSVSAVTVEVRNAVIEGLARHAPSRRAQLEDELSRADVVGQFRAMIARYGYQPLDLAHNLAAFLILQWETATGGRADTAQMRGTADQLQRALRANHLVRRMTDADKQATADALAYQAVLAVEIARRLRAEGRSAELDKLRAGVRATTRELGWDLDRLALTSRGFVPR